ncbi:MAG: ATP-binding protein [Bacteroidales bacterium]|nr:ATP-binding protein [Bacteroidales bacterium]MBK9358525.1 ATP-binding protein [Bacteroidales bacterium]
MVIRASYLEKIDVAFSMVPIVCLIGARQVGKTSLMKMFHFDGDKLFLNGQDPEVSGLFDKLPELEAYLKVYLNPELKGLLLVDEFQFIPRISTMLKLLSDKNDNLKILCSGSSGINIQQSVEESLAGRIRMIEVFSLSFSEYLLFKDEKLFELYDSFDLSTKDSALTAPFRSVLNEYLLYGGFPRAALTQDKDQKIAVLDDIYKTYLIRDVRSYVKNEHFTGFNRLLRMLAAQSGNMININELSRESGLAYRACDEYVQLLQQMYIIKLLEPFSGNKRSVITKMKKAYFTDTGLRNIINTDFNQFEFRPDKGALLENYVLLELSRNLRPGGKIQYYRTTDGTEVDFVVTQPDSRYALECKSSNPVKPVHTGALQGFGKLEGIDDLYLINLSLNLRNDRVKYLQAYLAGKI